MVPVSVEEACAVLQSAGLTEERVAGWLGGPPAILGDYAADGAAFSAYWQAGDALLLRLPERPLRNAEQGAAAALIFDAGRRARDAFLGRHAEALYRRLTDDYTRLLRVEALVEAAALAVPGLTPTRQRIAVESGRLQRDKDGVEIDQGLLLSHLLAVPAVGLHLCHAMLLPRPEALARQEEFLKSGAIGLPGAAVERRGRASHVTMRNPRFLNAEDDGTIDDLEIAVDLALLDPETEIIVLRGAPVEHPKYRGRRVFSTGINLTHLYHGRIPLLWYVRRELGLVNKLYRGLARPDASPDEMFGATLEKPVMAAVEAFAIGGGCQLLLVTDYVVAARGAYMTLPARKEGIIPGAANMRLPRFVGDRIARQAILSERRLDCDSPEGRMVCDEVVPPEAMDQAIDDAVARFTGSGVVSAAANRRALRVAAEPLDLFRRYMAVYAREQAGCHFSPALIANLERYWNAAQRKA